MRKLAAAIFIAMIGSPHLALAQVAHDPAAPAPRSTTVPQGAAGVLAEIPPTVVPGVTVTGRKLKPCTERDQACIDMVSRQIWTRFPEQIETMCTHESIRVMQQGFQEEQLGFDTTQVNTHLTPATKTLCDYGAKMKKEAKAQATTTITPDEDPSSPPKP